MIIKLKEKGIINNKRIEGGVKIDDVIMHENFIEPEKRRVSIYIKGNKVSGILNLKYDELASLFSMLEPGLKLVKSVKKIKG